LGPNKKWFQKPARDLAGTIIVLAMEENVHRNGNRLRDVCQSFGTILGI
jgi:hypothetical protein